MFRSNDLDNSLSGKTVKGTRLSRGAVDHVLKMAVPRRKYVRAKDIDTQIKYILLMNSSPLNYYRMQGHLIPYHENNKSVLVTYDSFFKAFGQGGPDI